MKKNEKNNPINEIEEEFAEPVTTASDITSTKDIPPSVQPESDDTSENHPESGEKSKKILAAVLAAVVLCAAGIGIYSFISGGAKKAISKAEQLVNEFNDLQGAVELLDKNMGKDSNGNIKQLRDQYFYWLAENKKAEADVHMRNYDYIAAAETLKPVAALNTDNIDPYLNRLYETCLNFTNSVEWTGDVEHVFFHSLIYDPAKTFVGDYQPEDFDDNYVTVTEFKRLLDRFYENNFILYDIRQLYSINEDGTIARKSVYVPEGKKPLVMSFDDTSYYDYMKGYGFVHGVDIGDDGMPRTYIWNEDGSKQYIEDGDYMPILEKFVQEHPDFSFGGAKGTIAVTGYEGILGYRTNELDAPDYDQKVQEARVVANRLKELGWNFASHSYGHRGFDERDAKWYATDTARWEAEVAPIFGGTDIYIYPFGTVPEDWNDAKQVDFMAHGFRIFCGVYKNPGLEYFDNFVYMNRRNIDGISLRDGRLDTLMDMTGIMESEVRPQR